MVIDFEWEFFKYRSGLPTEWLLMSTLGYRYQLEIDFTLPFGASADVWLLGRRHQVRVRGPGRLRRLRQREPWFLTPAITARPWDWSRSSPPLPSSTTRTSSTISLSLFLSLLFQSTTSPMTRMSSRFSLPFFSLCLFLSIFHHPRPIRVPDSFFLFPGLSLSLSTFISCSFSFALSLFPISLTSWSLFQDFWNAISSVIGCHLIFLAK